MTRIALLLALALVAGLAAPGPAGAQLPEPAPTLVERADSNVQAACHRADGPCPRPDVAAYEASDTHRALAFQYQLGSRVPLRNAPWVGTHNSFNSASEPFTLSGSDHNQQVSMTDQLRMDVRSLELDLHLVGGVVMVCHGRPGTEMNAGCTNERSLADHLSDLIRWLDANPGEVLLLYLEDDLGSAGHDEAAQILDYQLGDRLFRPAGGGCQKLPLDVTREAIRAAGHQVVLVSGCGKGGAWPGVVFDWGDHVEGRPVGYRADCGPDFTRGQYEGGIVRYFEDSTVLTATTAQVGEGEMDDGLTPETTAAMVRCGVDLFGFDQLLPDDGRLEALVWSWAPHPVKCASQGSDERWSPKHCDEVRPYACLGPAGWFVTPVRGTQEAGGQACAAAGGRYDLPRTGRENALLAEAAAGSGPWLAYTPPRGRGTKGPKPL